MRISATVRTELEAIRRKFFTRPSPVFAPVWHTATLSCGCLSKPAPVASMEAAGPGRVLICDLHQEYVIVVRTTLRLVEDPEVVRALFVAADAGDAGTVDYLTANAVRALRPDPR